MNSVTLEGKKGLVVGVANANSLAYDCATVFRKLGAELAITYRDTKAEQYVRPLAGELASPIIMPCDVRESGQLDHRFGLEDVGAVAAFPVGDWAKSLTGSTTYVDAGYHIIG
jgi:enoyl-[acyl-carrier-protein] reductase (NADH)